MECNNVVTEPMRKKNKRLKRRNIMHGKVKEVTSLIILLLIIFAIPLTGQTTVKPGATIVQVYSASLFFEGPTWDPVTQKLYFTTPNDSPYNVYRLDSSGQASIWLANSQRVNGMFISLDGRLLTCEQGAKRIGSYRIGASGPDDAKVLATDTSWNYPNDICQRKQGDIYFTCPNWENLTEGVFRIDTAGVVTKIISNMAKPNGIETSIDGTKLYISSSADMNWRVFPINADGTIGTGSVFFKPSTSNTNVPDGMTIDELGNLYFAGMGGVWIVSPAGTQLDFVSIPETCSNVTFGGTDYTTLYMTCQNKVYSLETTVHGAYYGWSSTPAPTANSSPAPTGSVGIKGDVNSNGSVDIVDALLIAQYYVGLNPANFSAANADVNCSGSIDIVDALLVAQYYVGLITIFPC
jgi:gluconolactonase